MIAFADNNTADAVTPNEEATVFVVDDLEANRDLLEILMKSVGLDVKTFPSAMAFLDTFDPSQSGCLLLDIRMPNMSGLELQKELKARDISIPVIIVTAHSDVPVAIQAMKEGAFDFIEKPFNNQFVLDRVYKALEASNRDQEKTLIRSDILARIESMTPREHEVMNRVVIGEPNKVIAHALDITSRTVEVHRARMMIKMQAATLADLVRMVVLVEAGDQHG
jgi:two-component system, LuxR family, response regulator FixJ